MLITLFRISIILVTIDAVVYSLVWRLM